MSAKPVFDPEKTLGSGLGKLTHAELMRLVKKLCEIAVAQRDEHRYRGGLRPGNINVEGDEVVVGPPDETKKEDWTKDELEYMAPEVFWNGKKTEKADVYSIGLILFAGLNRGNVPFVPIADYKPTPEIRANALRARMNGDKITMGKDIDPALAAVVEKAVSFSEDERYESPLELLNALRALDGEEPVKEIARIPFTVVKEAAKAEPAPEPKPIPEKKAELPKAQPAAKKPEPEKKEEPAPKAQPAKKVLSSYDRRSHRVTTVTLIVAAAIVCASCYLGEHSQILEGAYASAKEAVIALIDKANDPEPTPTPEPTPEATPTPTPEPTPTPTPAPVGPIREVIVEDVSWDTAEQKCRQMGGHLATITDEADYDKICELLKDTDADYVWIGCYRSDGKLVWTSGEDVNYFNWASGEPSGYDAYDGTSEDYIMLVRQPDGTWLYNDSRMDPISDYSYFYSGKVAYICQHG